MGSVEVDQVRLTWVADAAVPVRMVGTVGGAVSTVQLAVAGVAPPEAATVRVWAPWARPV